MKNLKDATSIVVILSLVIIIVGSLISLTLLNQNKKIVESMAQEWQCPGGNCDRCGVNGWWASGCDEFCRVNTCAGTSDQNICPCEKQESCVNGRWCGNDCRYHNDNNYRCVVTEATTPSGQPDSCIGLSEGCHNSRWCGNDGKWYDYLNWQCSLPLSPTSATENNQCHPPSSCVNERWCGNDMTYHDELNYLNNCQKKLSGTTVVSYCQNKIECLSNICLNNFCTEPTPAPITTPSPVPKPTVQPTTPAQVSVNWCFDHGFPSTEYFFVDKDCYSCDSYEKIFVKVNTTFCDQGIGQQTASIVNVCRNGLIIWQCSDGLFYPGSCTDYKNQIGYSNSQELCETPTSRQQPNLSSSTQVQPNSPNSSSTEIAKGNTTISNSLYSAQDKTQALFLYQMVKQGKFQADIVNNLSLGLLNTLTTYSNDFETLSNTLLSIIYGNGEEAQKGIQVQKTLEGIQDKVAFAGSIVLGIPLGEAIGARAISWGGSLLEKLSSVKTTAATVSKIQPGGEVVVKVERAQELINAANTVENSGVELGNKAAEVLKNSNRPIAEVAKSSAVQIPKQSFSWFERLLGKPSQIENQVVGELRSAADISDDLIKGRLRSLGYAENDIEEAATNIKLKIQSQSQSIPKVVPRITEPKVGNGQVMPQSAALSSHENIIQDVVYVNSTTKGIAIADGVTGAGPKSALTAKEVSQALADGMDDALSRYGSDYQSVFNQLEEQARMLDSKLAQKYYASTTVETAKIQNGNLITYRIGDVEARIVREGRIAQLDDLKAISGESLFKGNLVNSDVAYGTSFQSIKPNMPNQLGLGNLSQGRLTVHSLKSGDRLIYSSDGIAKVLNENEIQRIILNAKTPQEAEFNLIQTALSRNGGVAVDDYSAVVIFN